MPRIDDLASLETLVNAPAPAALPIPAPQIRTQGPNLPTQATPMRTAGPSGPTKGGFPWAEVARGLGPVIGGLAAGGRGPGATGFMQGWQQGQMMAAQEKEKRQLQQQAKQQQAAQFRMEIFEQAKQITDPQEWAQFVNLATDSAMQMGLIQDPSEIKQYLEYPAHLETKKKREAALSRLESLMRAGYDLDQLAEQNASVQIASGPRGAMETYKVRDLITIAGALPESGGKFVTPPKVKPNAPSDYEQSFARFLKGRDRTLETATSADEMEFKKQFNQADDKPVDPMIAELRGLNVELAKGRLANQGASAAGLPPNLQRQVDTLVRGFDAQPAVKRAQMAAESVAFANRLDTNTKNPADDQALIYAFAKAMDPDSVVREGEYATVQKYAQSWAESFGFNAQRIFSNTAFLTPQARQNMKSTIQKRFAASRGQYENLRKSYADRINKKTGKGDGADYLTDYGGAFPEGAAPAAETPAPAGQQRKVGRFEVSW